MVLVLLGSESDRELGERACVILQKLNIPYRLEIASCHRNPQQVDYLLNELEYDVVLCIAGLSAQLPGYCAARTQKPVIGIPRNVQLLGLDSLLSMVQLPRGTAVGVVGIDNAENGAILAAKILAVKDKSILARLKEVGS